MNDYPKLTEMGILHPGQIDRFQVSGFSNYDVLRVIYMREKGSILPANRTYKFPRVQKTGVVNKETGQTAVVMESNPDLRAALAELTTLLEAKQRKQDMAASVLEELLSLEEDVAMRSERIRELVNQIHSG